MRLQKPVSRTVSFRRGQGGQFPLKSRDGYNEFTKHWTSAEHLRKHPINYAIIGIGDKAYGGDLYCRPAIELNRELKLLGWRRAFGLLLRTPDIMDNSDFDNEVHKRIDWVAMCLKKEQGQSSLSDNDQDDVNGLGSASDVSLEDLGGLGDDDNGNLQSLDRPRKMLSESQGRTLAKQGYKLVGSHSAVKLCRWTKHQLRGQGGCYKHTFYGINSHRCMEATCSLACANKCVFCWRHHKNPVGTKWEWEMDDPEQIVRDGLKHQENMIKGMGLLPDVSETSYEEGMKVRHCALSLVGEPILYPAINGLIKSLHDRKISTFLVTNGQFPDQLRNLDIVTQLYMSIDGGDPQTLKNLDRPLFDDYWERFIECLKILRNRPERTVYRMTLVKGGNDKDTEKYASLISIGRPNFIEIKGVTFCGPDWGLTMKSVPTHEEVVLFSKELLEKLEFDDYEIACEHQHSCSVLLASRKFKGADGRWKTWIDFDYFFEWAQLAPFSGNHGEDYAVATPEWAVYGSSQRGFDPAFVRHKRNKENRKKEVNENDTNQKETQSGAAETRSGCCTVDTASCGCGKATDEASFFARRQQ